MPASIYVVHTSQQGQAGVRQRSESQDSRNAMARLWLSGRGVPAAQDSDRLLASEVDHSPTRICAEPI